MRNTACYQLKDPAFQDKLLQWAAEFPSHCFLNSSAVQQLPDTHAFLSGVGILEQIIPEYHALESLKKFYDQQKDWLFGFLSYDLKNEKDALTSVHPDGIGFPLLHFFKPRYVFECISDKLFIHHYETDAAIAALYLEILAQKIVPDTIEPSPQKMQKKLQREKYLTTVNAIKEQIRLGQLYEMNYCQEFFLEGIDIKPEAIYHRLNKYSPTPFSCFYKLEDKYLISASPERFLKKTGNRLLSQPIKGTIKRGKNPNEDALLKSTLKNNEKEKAENIMIVDLVRNDLAQTAVPGSVHVEELCGIYTFPQVHQMISSITSTIRKDLHFTDAIKAAFPMGSMTGAPKINAMKLIEHYELSKRGLYSGAVGYISPNSDFDFNVVIRSIQYNSSTQYLNFMVGSAITAASDGALEYEECLVKAEAMLKALNAFI
jgi:para-aminobenzoate synthetase component 1